MATKNVRVMRCTPEDVFAVLADGWVYPVWVVGASRMRDVDASWPEPGSVLHHSLGVWPVLFDDETEMLEWSPPEQLRLRARASFLGRGVVVLEVRPGETHDGGPTTRVRMGEEAVTGPATLLPRVIWAPLLTLRNREALRRLSFLAEGRARERAAAEGKPRPAAPPAKKGRPSAEAKTDAREAKDAGSDAADARSDVAPDPA